MLRVSPLAFTVCASVPPGMSAKLATVSSIRQTIAMAISSGLFLASNRWPFAGQLIGSGGGRKSRERRFGFASSPERMVRELSGRITLGRVLELLHRPVPVPAKFLGPAPAGRGRAGIGRSSLIAACVLVLNGYAADLRLLP